MLTDPLCLPFVGKPVFGKIKVPGSKSITNRALIIAALAQNTSRIQNYLDAEDTQIMLKCLRSLGVEIKKEDNTLIVKGTGGKFLAQQETLYIGNAGTVARFLCPVLSLGQGTYTLDGSQRMRQRPIAELLQAMHKAGCQTKSLTNQSFPLQVTATRFGGGKITLKGNISSQFISAIMLVAPLAAADTFIEVSTEITSLPYIEMTRKMMESFGVRCDWLGPRQLFIPAAQTYQARAYTVEGDASAASYFFAMAAISGGKISVAPIFPKSLQGDLGFLQILKNMGCRVEWNVGEVSLQGAALTGVQVDMSHQNDVVLTLAVVALFARGTTTINNIYNLRLKECDRLSALATQLTKLGAKIKETRDSLQIEGLTKYHSSEVATYDDHRMAMSFSLCSLKIPSIKIQNPFCVQKTYPLYWEDFFSLL